MITEPKLYWKNPDWQKQAHDWIRAEAAREKRARIIKAEAELEASEKLTQGAQRISESPMALELRRMQMISEVGAEQNTPFPAATATAAAR